MFFARARSAARPCSLIASAIRPVPRSSTVNAFVESSLVNPNFANDRPALSIASCDAVNDSPLAFICAASWRCDTPASRAASTLAFKKSVAPANATNPPLISASERPMCFVDSSTVPANAFVCSPALTRPFV